MPLALYTATPFFIISSKKQVKSLEDLQGMKVRIVGGPGTAHFKALGGVPTPMPMPDVYQALDKGVIDGAGAPWEAVHAFRLYEVGKYVTMAPLATVYFSICANRAKIESLPADVRAQIMSVGGLAGSKFWGKNFFDSAEAGVYDDLKKAKRATRALRAVRRRARALDRSSPSRSTRTGSSAWRPRATRKRARS